MDLSFGYNCWCNGIRPGAKFGKFTVHEEKIFPIEHDALWHFLRKYRFWNEGYAIEIGKTAVKVNFVLDQRYYRVFLQNVWNFARPCWIALAAKKLVPQGSVTFLVSIGAQTKI
jgi:hypothetical protein